MLSSNQDDFYMNISQYNLTPNLFAEAFPFHLVLTQELRIIQVGAVIKRICHKEILDSNFEDYFRIIKPNIPLETARIKKKSHTFFLLESIHQSFQLKGQMSIDEDNDLIFFLGSPWIEELSQVSKIGLKLKDFAIHDPIVDFLFLFQSHKTSLNDAIKTSESLREKQSELESTLAVIHDKNERLKKTMDELNAAQERMIHTEKMVSLGQLISGIAHEINTPLGAIRSSVENISDFVSSNMLDLPRYFKSLPSEYLQLFSRVISGYLSHKKYLSSRERRKIKRQISKTLVSEEIQNPELLADTLSDLNAYLDIDDIIPYLKTEEGINVINKAYLFSTIYNSAETINIATKRASKIVFALKNYSRHDLSQKKSKANIIHGIETVLTLYTSQIKHGVDLVKNYSEIPNIYCYPDELDQVWTNLIHNSLQAMDNNGALILDVYQDDEKIIVRITDSGVGIPDEYLSKVFTPFFTTKPPGEGTGMGLDIVKNIINKHSGEISVESIPGKTLFIVSLPILN